MKKSRTVLKNIRKSAKRRTENTLKKKKIKDAVKKLKKLKTKKAALKHYPEVQSLIDKATQDGIIAKNAAGRRKAKLLRDIKKSK
ncbi:MAG: 30S ribosomal protein S20 [candidate division WOR-3 bacterium]|nr:MAG: 30S ribosomal protein S20 [candidate division WOR-3 bacterium]